MTDPTETPWAIVVSLFLIPVGVGIFLFTITFRRLTPLVFHCRRCDRDFFRAPYRRFPIACPFCRARDWSA